jgi:hypothetical protein
MIDHLPCFSFSQARLSSLHHDPYDMILYLVWLSVLFDLNPAGFPFVVFLHHIYQRSIPIVGQKTPDSGYPRLVLRVFEHGADTHTLIVC